MKNLGPSSFLSKYFVHDQFKFLIPIKEFTKMLEKFILIRKVLEVWLRRVEVFSGRSLIESKIAGGLEFFFLYTDFCQ